MNGFPTTNRRPVRSRAILRRTRRNPQKHPSKDTKQYAEIPKQKHPKCDVHYRTSSNFCVEYIREFFICQFFVDAAHNYFVLKNCVTSEQQRYIWMPEFIRGCVMSPEQVRASRRELLEN